MPLVSKPFAFACCAERLTWTRSGPDFLIVRPVGEFKGIGPSSNSCKEVTATKSLQITREYVFNGAIIHESIGNETIGDEIAQPRCRLGIVLVVVVHQRIGRSGSVKRVCRVSTMKVRVVDA